MTENRSRLTDLLIEPAYRTWRLLFFILVGGIITTNMVFVAYMDCSIQLGNRIYLLCLLSLVVFALAMAFNYYYLIPKYLLKGSYTIYFLSMIATAYLLPTLSTVQEYGFRTEWHLPHRISSYTSPLILLDNFSSCMLLLICFLSLSAIALFREWKLQDEYLNVMEHEHLQAEVNKLKGQVTPSFLSKTLIKAAGYIKTNPGKATEILMQLGRLLRYQLYDCNRENVLLTSEINFLDNFLRTEQMINEKFTYKIQTAGNLNNIFVPPLLFISVIQYVTERSTYLQLLFSHKEDSLLFKYDSDAVNTIPDSEIDSLKRRLDLHYSGAYTFSPETGTIEIKMK